jgi:hypothetical protein
MSTGFWFSSNILKVTGSLIAISELEKKYAHALDNYGQSCFVRSDFIKMKCVCKTQMMSPPDHQNPVDMHTSNTLNQPNNWKMFVYKCYAITMSDLNFNVLLWEEVVQFNL